MTRRTSFFVALSWFIALPLTAQSLFTTVGAPNPDGAPPVGTNALYNVSVDLDVLASNPASLTVDLPSGQVTLTQEHFLPIDRGFRRIHTSRHGEPSCRLTWLPSLSSGGHPAPDAAWLTHSAQDARTHPKTRFQVATWVCPSPATRFSGRPGTA